MWDGMIVLGILGGIGFLIYTRVKNQNLKETYDEIKELFTITN